MITRKGSEEASGATLGLVVTLVTILAVLLISGYFIIQARNGVDTNLKTDCAKEASYQKGQHVIKGQCFVNDDCTNTDGSDAAGPGQEWVLTNRPICEAGQYCCFLQEGS